jgi:DNA-binding LacI/PurR family transcriptional regulator
MGQSPVCTALSPKLTTVRFHYQVCGRHATNLLISRINGDMEIFSQTKLGYDFVEGETV